MSITSCVDCGVFIDTDAHPECYDAQDRPYCWSCAVEAKDGKDYTAKVERAMREPEENDDAV